ncbi:tRNA pseudouridine(38-40) synthase TruA [Pelagibacterales bacterium SAG-MED24]|nr:tRNA pseudouridine(38-40) synthase TruA [Pelagibacterales bacterium SAG-MED24]MBD1153600.1 tRNA pseudouridine(38-40) synthase TruA [Pelagibacterales bacterium SAG-MED23]
MFRYQILIEYVGTSFIGWQVQTKGKTIQGLIQKKISNLLNEKIVVTGSGRTDTGVHAIEQSAHFDSIKKIQNLNKFCKSINYFLNKHEIAILKIKKKNMNFHARFSAKERTYKYIIFNQFSKPILQNKRGWFVIKNLELEIMKKGAKKLIGTHDFSTFRASGCNAKSPIKSIKSVKIKKIKNKIEFEFRSQSFLKQQVRSMVGCLKYIGEKKWTVEKFTSVIKSKNRNLCAPPAPAEGLFLQRVLY